MPPYMLMPEYRGGPGGGAGAADITNAVGREAEQRGAGLRQAGRAEAAEREPVRRELRVRGGECELLRNRDLHNNKLVRRPSQQRPVFRLIC